MNAPTRHLVALVIAGNLMGCQLIKKFTDRNRDSGTVAPTGTTVVTLDGGMVVPVVAYDAAMWGDAAAAMAAANAAMANAADASAMAAQAMQNAQNAMGDAGVAAVAPGMAPGVAPAADPGAAPAAPPPVAAADPAPAAPPPVAAADPAPAAPAGAAEDAPRRRSDRDYCRRHPGGIHPRTGQICPNVLGSQNLMR